MITFNELRFSEDGRTIIIDASVSSSTYYENVYIETVSIDSHKDYVPSGPSSNAQGLWGSPNEPAKNVRLEVPLDNIKRRSKEDMFYVYVQTTGTPSPETPCGMDNITTMGILVDWKYLYHKGLKFMKQVIDGCCDIPRDAIDWFLRYKTLEMCLATGNYPKANDIWDRWFSEENSPSQRSIAVSGCGRC